MESRLFARYLTYALSCMNVDASYLLPVHEAERIIKVFYAPSQIHFRKKQNYRLGFASGFLFQLQDLDGHCSINNLPSMKTKRYISSYATTILTATANRCGEQNTCIDLK